MADPTTRWDGDALVAGFSVAVLIALPFAVLGRWAVDHDWDGAGIAVANLGMITGLFLGAGVAAWRQRRRTPLSHGLVVALGSYVVIQTLVVIARLVRGGEVRWGAAVANVFFALGAGLLGGFAGQALLRHGLLPPSAAPSPPPTPPEERP